MTIKIGLETGVAGSLLMHAGDFLIGANPAADIVTVFRLRCGD